VSLLVLAGFAFVCSLIYKMKDVIDAILAMRIVLQFVGQAVGVLLLRKRNGTKNLPFKMPLYPLPVLLAIAMWLFIFFSIDYAILQSFIKVFVTGIVVYFVFAKIQQQWPFNKKDTTDYSNTVD
jgi:amino acid transporter